jgi:DNA gyrase subunit B
LKKYADASGMLDKLKFEIAGDDFREGSIAQSSEPLETQFEKRVVSPCKAVGI